MRKLGGAKGEDGNEVQSDPSPIFFFNLFEGAGAALLGPQMPVRSVQT